MRLQTETQSDIHFTLRYVPIEDMVGASLGPAQPGPSQDVGEGTVRISAGGSNHGYVNRLLSALPHESVACVTARGPAVAKAVTVAEITKRRMRGLHQSTQIGLATSSCDDHGPSSATGELAPTIRIVLSVQPLDASLPGCVQASPVRPTCYHGPNDSILPKPPLDLTRPCSRVLTAWQVPASPDR